MNVSFPRRLTLRALTLLAACAFVSCSQSSFDEQCLKQAKDFTDKQCPQRITDGVIMDSLTYSPQERSMSYHYTLSGTLDDADLLDTNKDTFREQLLNTITNSVELRRAKKEGITFRYIYRSKTTKKELMNITIAKDEYTK